MNEQSEQILENLEEAYAQRDGSPRKWERGHWVPLAILLSAVCIVVVCFAAVLVHASFVPAGTAPPTTTLRKYDAQLLFESGALAGAASVMRFQTQQHRLPTDAELLGDVWHRRTNNLSIR